MAVIDRLISLGATMDVCNNNGLSPLHLAAQGGSAGYVCCVPYDWVGGSLSAYWVTDVLPRNFCRWKCCAIPSFCVYFHTLVLKVFFGPTGGWKILTFLFKKKKKTEKKERKKAGRGRTNVRLRKQIQFDDDTGFFFFFFFFCLLQLAIDSVLFLLIYNFVLSFCNFLLIAAGHRFCVVSVDL